MLVPIYVGRLSLLELRNDKKGLSLSIATYLLTVDL